MWGAIIGDIAGSRFEFHNLKSKEFDLFSEQCRFTDDTVMTLAVCQALKDCNGNYSSLAQNTIQRLKEFGRRYSDRGYGSKFIWWLFSSDVNPYNSCGNGAAMRVSPVAYFANSIEQVKELSYAVTAVTHNHPEGIKGAEATAIAIYLAKCGKSKAEIKQYVEQNYYKLDFTVDQIRPTYGFDETCQNSVPQAIQAFLESESFEDAVRTAVSLGGDSDTIGAICGSIAEAFYGISDEFISQAATYLDDYLLSVLD